VRAHDAAIADRDEQLATWIADRSYQLQAECEGLRFAVDPRPKYKPADGRNREENLDKAIVERREEALQQWRDEERRARLDIATILAAEGWPHRLFRRLTRRAAPTLATPERGRWLLEAWRKPSVESGAAIRPVDATKRTLEDAIQSMPATGP
jgi:hypothetical protein